MSHSKLLKFIRNEDVYREVYDVLFKNLPQLKELFTYCIGTSSYPYISWLEFSDLCATWKIPGKLVLK